VDALEIVTLVVAIVGAVTGVAALVWEAVTFVLSGSRVKVALVHVWLGGGSVAVTVPLSEPIGKQPPSPHATVETLGVEVRNVGRLAVSVTDWRIKIGPTELISLRGVPHNKQLPHRLDVGEENTWFVEVAQIHAAVSAAVGTFGPVEIRARASLGTGKSTTSRNSISLSP
jgi:hypothetical protein